MEGIPKENSEKWNKYDGMIVLILSGAHFSILAIQKKQVLVELNIYICVMQGELCPNTTSKILIF